ncbi:MAG: methylmalonyl-CoA epimerase [Anaerolineaceae bacterium]|jgi:methylmalonyl-CoA/ethylmalonyl-CoA epimerase|nr:MAG: methylmalonyl-CoA epimerase [Anaerolineaceae bacterium]
MKVKKINHVAVAVEDISKAAQFWESVLGLKLDRIEEVESQHAKVAFFPCGESEVELVEPTDTESGTARFLQTRGPGIHHLCLEVNDIDKALEELKAKDVRLINETAIVMEGRKMAFIHPKSSGGVLIELYQIL